MCDYKFIPNPFSVRPIKTEWTSNDLLLKNTNARLMARVEPLDRGLKQSSHYHSPLHINPGWAWCGPYPNCARPNTSLNN